jgi:hypothetical protein
MTLCCVKQPLDNRTCLIEWRVRDRDRAPLLITTDRVTPFIAAEIQAEALTAVKGTAVGRIERTEYFAPGELVFSWFENKKLGYRVEFKAKRKEPARG